MFDTTQLLADKIAELKSALAEKDAKIERLKDKVEDYQDVLQTYKESLAFSDSQLAQVVAELTTLREKHRWISIAERLPERGLLSLVFDKATGVYYVARLGYDKEDGLGWMNQERKTWTDLNRFTHYLIITPPDTSQPIENQGIWSYNLAKKVKGE